MTLSSNVICDSNKDTNFPYILLLNDGQILRLCKAFANNSSVTIKLSQSQLFKIAQLRQFAKSN